MGGKLLLKLNTNGRPIANKYREGKMKRTLKRVIKQGLKLLRGKALETNRAWSIQRGLAECRAPCMSVSAGAVVDAVVRDVPPSGGIHDAATIAPTEVNSRTLSDRGLSWQSIKVSFG